MLKAPGTDEEIVVAIVRDGTRRMLFDVNEQIAFKRADGTFADVRELRANPSLIPAVLRSRTVRGVPYEHYLDTVATVEPRWDHMEAQRPWQRLRQEVAKAFSRGPER